MEQLEINKIKNFVLSQTTEWKSLHSFVNSSDFEKIMLELWKLKQENKRFTPTLKQMFRCFDVLKYENVRVVFLAQDPYPQKDVADGLAFSCSNINRPLPSLREIFREINRTVYKDEKRENSPDLLRWSKQGILLLNTALSCEIQHPGSHYYIWKDFTAYVIDEILNKKKSLIYILMGKKAQEWEALINENHYILKSSHPASAGYTGDKWDCEDVFNKCNELLTEKINW